MKVELFGSRKKALLKGCLWMGESEVDSEGGQDEASQQAKLWRQRCSIVKTDDKEEFSKFYYL